MINFSSTKEIPSDFPHIMVDSGGYQLQSGTDTLRNINAEHYCLWLELELKNYPDLQYMNLDIKGNDEQSVKNLHYMEKNGLHPIPVWHGTTWDGENYYLDYYCSNYEYVAIGGMVVRDRELNLYKMFQYINQKYPTVKFHLLGIGSRLSSIINYLIPYSTDASSWMVTERFGNKIELVNGLLKELELSEEDKKRVREDKVFALDRVRKNIRNTKEFEFLINKMVKPSEVQPYLL